MSMPGNADEEEDMFGDHVARHPNFCKKGPYVKLKCWFSLCEASAFYDNKWSSWRKLQLFICENLMKGGKSIEKIQDS